MRFESSRMNKSGTTNRKVTRREVIRKVLKDRKHVWHKLVGCVGPEMEETFGQEKSGKVVVKRNMTRTSITDLMVVLNAVERPKNTCLCPSYEVQHNCKCRKGIWMWEELTW